MNEFDEQHINNQRQYLWDYFHIHASQRLTTFNFYIIISSLISSGYVTTVGSSVVPRLAILLGVILVLFSFIFWKLDTRNKQLIKNAEEGLKYLENLSNYLNGVPTNNNVNSVLRIFSYEEEQTNKMKEKYSFWPWKNFYSYSKCFNTVFMVFGISWFVGTVYAIVISFIS